MYLKNTIVTFCLLFPGVLTFTLVRAQSGMPDTSFNSKDTAAYLQQVGRAILHQPDGKVILGSGRYAEGVFARYHANGSYDSSFHTGTGFNYDVLALALQPDGKIIAAGYFFTYNGDSCSNLIRINIDGSLDRSFNVPPGLPMTHYAAR